MPAVVEAVPDALYVILRGHPPRLLLREGEAYRESLVARASELGVGDHVRFVNRFVTQAELGRWLQAADLFVTPYPGLEQIVSGTLSYAVGAGKAIVSTPYEYAVELLAEGRGILVPPASVSSLASRVRGPAGRSGPVGNGWALWRTASGVTWCGPRSVGPTRRFSIVSLDRAAPAGSLAPDDHSRRRCFAPCCRGCWMPDSPLVHPVRREHVEALTGEFGIMQHARGGVPDPAHGSCTDDVARALVVDLLQARVVGWEAVRPSVRRSLRFLSDAVDAGAGRARNLRRVDGSWLDEVGSEDSHGRALFALGETIRRAPDPAVRQQASKAFARALPAALMLTAIRARASSMLGCDAATRGGGIDSALPAAYRRLTAGLRRTFEAGGYVREWPWPENSLTYENGLPAQALIVAGSHLGDADAARTGLRALDWLLAVQTLPDGRLSPVGCSGWWPRNGPRARFDQQPIEATSLLLAADAAYRTTGRECYRAAAERAYAWFLGDNDVGVAVADPARGACHDGLTPDGVNANQGAEIDAHVADCRGAHAGAGKAAGRSGGGACLVGASVSRPCTATLRPGRGEGVVVSGPEPLFRRDPTNPILTAADLPYPANAVFNPGAVRLDGETVLLVRVEDMRGISQLHVARSADGVSGWRFDATPLLRSDPELAPEEVWGCEDPRLTWLPDEGTWVVAYTAYSRRGPLVVAGDDP